MTTLRQIAANRRNAERSTGPRTKGGKRRSRRNALRHGLCAETVVEIFEDIDDYKAFEIAIASEYDARSVVERELLLRLASLLWRIRRATAIETALLRIQAESLADRPPALAASERLESRRHKHFHPAKAVEFDHPWGGKSGYRDDCEDVTPADGERELHSSSFQASMHDLANCFKALLDHDNGVFARLGRYEASLWRQFAKTLFVLQSARSCFSPALGNRWCNKE